MSMQTVPRCRGWVAWWVLAILVGCPRTATWAGSVTLGQAPGQPAAPADKDLEAAVHKVREGRNDEALASIREQAARHPEWPPAALILSRMLRAADQAVPARRALERAAVEAPGHPDVYLTFGTLALADGRLSDARLNFDNALALVGSGQWDAERARVFRREAFAGLAAVAEGREDWAAAQAALNAWLELEPQKEKDSLSRPRAK
jgi:tetratricopeptide (TPR) repeat protein